MSISVVKECVGDVGLGLGPRQSLASGISGRPVVLVPKPTSSRRTPLAAAIAMKVVQRVLGLARAIHEEALCLLLMGTGRSSVSSRW